MFVWTPFVAVLWPISCQCHQFFWPFQSLMLPLSWAWLEGLKIEFSQMLWLRKNFYDDLVEKRENKSTLANSSRLFGLTPKSESWYGSDDDASARSHLRGFWLTNDQSPVTCWDVELLTAAIRPSLQPPILRVRGIFFKIILGQIQFLEAQKRGEKGHLHGSTKPPFSKLAKYRFFRLESRQLRRKKLVTRCMPSSKRSNTSTTSLSLRWTLSHAINGARHRESRKRAAHRDNKQ